MDNNHRGASKSNFQTHKNTNVNNLFNDALNKIFHSENTTALQKIDAENSQKENNDLQQQKMRENQYILPKVKSRQ